VIWLPICVWKPSTSTDISPRRGSERRDVPD
jgi:hypothetical protein